MIELILHRRRTARLALDVLLGAVETDPRTAALPVRLASRVDELSDAIRGAVAEGRQPVVAWSFYTASFAEAAAELRAVRAAEASARPEPVEGRGLGAIHVAGGPHATAAPQEVLAAGFELCAVGEGEETLPALLARLAAGEDARVVPGLAWLEAGALRTSGRASPVDLDAFPPCAPRARRIGPIEITRGCVWACRFCQTPFQFKARFRHRSLEGVRRWVKHHAELGTRDIRFLTPSALSWGSPDGGCDEEAIEALLATARDAAGPGPRLFLGSFPSELRPEHVSARNLAAIQRHCDNRAVIIGAQSGSERLLQAMGRGHGVDAVRRAVALALEAGFTPDVDLVFGLPGEEEADRAASRALAAELAGRGARIHAHAFMPLPGTPWANAPFGAIDGETSALLERLASRGAAHGQWKRQQELARKSADPRRGHPLN